jgi:hypothetical protein
MPIILALQTTLFMLYNAAYIDPSMHAHKTGYVDPYTQAHSTGHIDPSIHTYNTE